MRPIHYLRETCRRTAAWLRCTAVQRQTDVIGLVLGMRDHAGCAVPPSASLACFFIAGGKKIIEENKMREFQCPKLAHSRTTLLILFCSYSLTDLLYDS